MSDYGPLKKPSRQAIEVFEKVIENNPDADMRAIPNEWLLKDRGISAKLSERISTLESTLRAAIDELREMYHYDGCTDQEIEDQLARFSAPLTGDSDA